MSLRDRLLERDRVPDRLARTAIRQILRQRLRDETRRERLEAFVAELRQSPIALHTDAAKAQHYEVPADFFSLVLGPRLKYSCGLWPDAGGGTLAESEDAMLALTCDRARLVDGQRILELGCGWGSLTLFMAERFPASTIVAVSNWHSQRAFIEQRAAARRFGNVRVVAADMNDFAPEAVFDRLVSVEVFEHMRNYPRLLERIAGWLAPRGELFVHLFSHVHFAYPYEISGPSDWMAEHFFTGGTMPSDQLLYRFQDHLRIEAHWAVNGSHYERTANAWLANLDRNREGVDRVLAAVYGAHDVTRWRVRWRVFFNGVRGTVRLPRRDGVAGVALPFWTRVSPREEVRGQRRGQKSAVRVKVNEWHAPCVPGPS